MNDTTAQGAPRVPPKRLVRTPDRKVAGVAAGIAHYLGVDPTIVRIAFVALLFAGGVGGLLYLICIFVMPKGEIDDRGPAPQLDTATIAGLVGLAIGVPLLIGWHGIDNGVRAVIATGLIVGGVLLLGRRGQAGGPDGGMPAPPAPPPFPGAPPPSSPEPPAAAGDSPTPTAATLATPLATPAPATPTPYGPVPGSPPTTREAAPAASRRGVVSTLVIGLAVVAGAVTAALGLTDRTDVSVATGLAIALVVVGVGLAVSAFTGGAPALAVLGALLTVALVVAAGLRGLVDDGVGDRTVAPASLAELGPDVTYGIGDLTVDLSRVDLRGETRDLHVKLGIGSAKVIVPADVDLEIRGEVTGGEIRLPDGSSTDGWHRDVDWQEDVPDDTGRLRLDLDLRFGEAVISRG